jgi:secreted trypsin-like serine protease
MKFSWICTAVLTVSTATAASAGSDVRRQTRENDALVIDKIIGGNFAAAKEFPYMAIPESDALCGATLIHSDILLTAAHCAGSFEGFNVFIGGVFFNGTDAKNTIQAVQERAHPEYNDINLENDIMLVKLASRSTQPKASWSSNSRVPLTGSTVRAIGFGVTEFIGDYDILVADTLMKVDLNVFEVDICQDITGFDSAFCAGAEGKATCFGDSGG